MNHFSQQLQTALQHLTETPISPTQTKTGLLKTFKKLRRTRQLTWQNLQKLGITLTPTDLAQNWHTMPPYRQSLYALLYQFAPNIFHRIPNEDEVARLSGIIKYEPRPELSKSEYGHNTSDWRHARRMSQSLEDYE